MSELRWILTAAGALLVLGIYAWGRWRRPKTSEYASLKRDVSFGAGHETLVPQLDEPIVRTRTREVAPPIVVEVDSNVADTLPPMHADLGSSVVEQSTESQSTSQMRREPSIEGLSTGAFIAAQAQPRESQLMVEAIHAQPGITEAVAPPKAMNRAEAQQVESVTISDSVDTLARPKKRPTGSRKIVALRLSAGATRVDGARLKSLLESAGLTHGKYSIYHRMQGDATVFSVASMVEPGTFEPSSMSGVKFPGVTLFMQLPGAIGGSEMLDQMLSCARMLEQGIGGILQDERGLPLTEQRAQRLRDDIADFEHLLGSA